MRRDAVLFALQEGNKLDTASAERIEANLRADPSDVDARLTLLGYLAKRYLSSPELGRRRAGHIVWFIENEPQHEIVGSPLANMSYPEEPGLAEATAAWATHLAKPNPDPNVLLRAAHFFSLVSATESQKLLERGERLRPDWSTWAHDLGTLAFRPVAVARSIALSGREPLHPILDADACRAEAAIALVHFERALRLCTDDDDGRFSELADAADAALEADEKEKARSFAREILRLAPGQAANRHRLDYIHTAHIVLGHVAVLEGDDDRAADELLAAGKVGCADAPVLQSFGPDFSLASRLYARGLTAAVLAYLDECARFWNPKRIAFWRTQIRRGEGVRLYRGYDPDLPS